jgi:hypothetical protein
VIALRWDIPVVFAVPADRIHWTGIMTLAATDIVGVLENPVLEHDEYGLEI